MFLVFRERLTYANVMATIAVFGVLGGGAYAAGIGKDDVTSKQIKAGAVKSAELAKNAVTSPKVEDGSLSSQDFAAGQLPAGPQGIEGPAGRSALTPLRSGETMTGLYFLSAAGSGPSSALATVNFPLRAPEPVDSRHVVIAGNDTVTGDGCTGTAAAPVAAPGYVCLYFLNATSTSTGGGMGGQTTTPFGSSIVTGDGSVDGFIVRGTGNDNWYTNGVWIYKAP